MMPHDADERSDAPPPQMRVLQPWSDSARAEAAKAKRHPSHRGATVRRRKVERFTEHLVDIVVRDMEDDRTLGAILTLLLKVVWVPLMFAGAVVIRHLISAPTWSQRELAAGLSVSVILGIVLAQLWGSRNASSAPRHPDDPPDPYGPAQEEVGFPTLRRRGRPKTDPTEREY